MGVFGFWMGTVRRIQVLAEGECGLVRDELHALRASWCRRRASLPFYTLGAAAYLDARRSAAEYARRAGIDNPLLRERFARLHERVADALGDLLGAPARTRHEHALPGFHLYLSHPVFERPIAEVHFDLQQHRLAWGDAARVDWSRPVSFTLPIALPRSGGGLHTWDLTFDETVRLGRDERRERFRTARRERHAYRLGELVVHSGHVLHQAAPGSDLSEDDERFTLQGHALLRDGVWDLYW